MRFKVTKKAVLSSGARVYKTDFCGLQHLLVNKDSSMYSASNEGWDCDYYVFNKKNIVISTGYRPVGTDIDYSLVKEYESKAVKLLEDNNYSGVNELLNQFVNELVGD